MIAYKGFNSDLTCRGYQFVMGMNVTDKANCAQNGFHCAENPLDCLTYYPSLYSSVYCIVDAGGDIDEDNNDSKISCTELNVVKILSLEEFFLHCLAFMVDHPKREASNRVSNEQGAAGNGYAVVRGLDPIAKGEKIGDILAFAKNSAKGGKIEKIAVVKVDGKNVLPNIWYDIELSERSIDND